MPKRILVADDSPDLRLALHSLLSSEQLEKTAVKTVESGQAALRCLREETAAERPKLVLLGMELPGMDGVETLRRLRRRDPATPVVCVMDQDSVDVAIRAMQAGATDVLVRPLEGPELETLLARHLETSVRSVELDVAPDAVKDRDVLLGRSPGILEVFKTVGRVAPTNATVLITGESGTGKELIAELLHKNSTRYQEPFQVVNCAAIPENLLESELFGHEKGAFTGADSRQIGKFESAHGGTLFLDEIGDMSLANQRKILRALEAREIERVGASQAIEVDVRVVAATHLDLWEKVKDGSFRRDLYYRLAVVNLRVPPLRDRKEDIRLLADHFIARFAHRSGRSVERVACEVYDRLEAYDWPGNVRELRNVLERSVILGRGPLLTADELPELLASAGPETAEGGEESKTLRCLCRERASLERLERQYIESVLEEVGWNYSEAAEVLQIHRNTLRRKMRQYGLKDPSRGSLSYSGSDNSS